MNEIFSDIFCLHCVFKRTKKLQIQTMHQTIYNNANQNTSMKENKSHSILLS